MRSARVPRWAVSFADLCLLLLGFFVLVQAHQSRPDRLSAGLRSAFGGKAAALPGGDYRANEIFQRGEAILVPQAVIRLARIGGEAQAAGASVRVVSAGVDGGTHRFDRWELAAARAAAVARALRSGGLDERRIMLSMPSAAVGDEDGKGQVISVISTLPE